MPDRDIVKIVPSMHKCMECGNKVRVGRQESWKTARPYCPACGCKRLEPIEKEEKKDDQ